MLHSDWSCEVGLLVLGRQIFLHMGIVMATRQILNFGGPNHICETTHYYAVVNFFCKL